MALKMFKAQDEFLEGYQLTTEGMMYPEPPFLGMPQTSAIAGFVAFFI